MLVVTQCICIRVYVYEYVFRRMLMIYGDIWCLQSWGAKLAVAVGPRPAGLAHRVLGQAQSCEGIPSNPSITPLYRENDYYRLLLDASCIVFCTVASRTCIGPLATSDGSMHMAGSCICWFHSDKVIRCCPSLACSLFERGKLWAQGVSCGSCGSLISAQS